jgi:hypothetical protein
MLKARYKVLQKLIIYNTGKYFKKVE